MELLTKSKRKIILRRINKEDALIQCETIISLINIIPYLNCNKDELFQERNPLFSKWDYSLGAYNETGDLVGILLAYYRKQDDIHDIDSLYIHRLAVKQTYQKEGIGKNLIKNIIRIGFENIHDLQYISIQTNLEYKNKYVIDFYHKIGFDNKYLIQYSNKIDILMVFSRNKYFQDFIID